MSSFLRILAGLVSVVSSLVRMFEGWRMRKEARAIVTAEIKAKEAEIERSSNEVLNEPRPPDDASRRLRNGDF